ncbi:MAG: hypothetical protein H7Z74_17965 [Anaerolineae bacterium]|nr:hypothetical protein [Gemmatimonadaceae bacterium]
MTNRCWLLAALGIAVMTPRASAQRLEGAGREPGRAALEQRVRERMAEVVKVRVGVTDAQMEKIGATNRKFEEQRRVLVAQERDIRMGVREEVLAGDKADQNRVARLLDQMVKVQRERLSLLEQEQRDLAAFLTPVQRAKYMAVQEQIRNRMDEMRQNREGKQGAARRPGKGLGRNWQPDASPF